MTFFDLLNTATNGIQAQRDKMNVLSENIANSNTPGYKRKVAILGQADSNSFASIMASQLGVSNENIKKFISGNQTGGVSLRKIVEDRSSGEKVYMPQHPNADKNGYVESSNVDSITEMLEMLYAVTNYKANLSIVEMVKSAARETLNIGKSGA